MIKKFRKCYMKYIKNYSQFSNTNIPFYFIKYFNTVLANENDTMTLNEKAKIYFLQNFVQTIILDNVKDIDTLPFENKSIIYSFHPINVFKERDNSEKLKQIYHKYKNKNYNLYIPNNLSSSKVDSQWTFRNYDFYIKGVTSLSDIHKIKFPVVAKPESGHSGKGIQKFDTLKDLTNFINKHGDIFELYSQYTKHQREYRCVLANHKIVSLIERIPNTKTNVTIETKKKDDLMDFVYVHQDIENVSFLTKLQNIIDSIFPIINIPIYVVDFFLTDDNELKVIEINTKPGVKTLSLIELYRGLYELSFSLTGNDIPFNEELTKLEYIIYDNDYKEYKKEIDKSLTPSKLYNDKLPIDETLKAKILHIDNDKII